MGGYSWYSRNAIDQEIQDQADIPAGQSTIRNILILKRVMKKEFKGIQKHTLH